MPDLDLAAAIRSVYAQADLDPSLMTPGIVPLYELISGYSLRIAELKELSYLTAARFLERETGQPIPVPQGGDRELAGFLYIYKYRVALYGCVLVEHGDSIERRRFSAAHELGHYVLHCLPQLRQADQTATPLILAEGLIYDAQGETKDTEPTGRLMFTRSVVSGTYTTLGDLYRLEREANRFAAACRTLVERESQRLGTRGPTLARRLASEFLVSQEAMRWRLKNLSLLDTAMTNSLFDKPPAGLDPAGG
jgi:hypothetical protein